MPDYAVYMTDPRGKNRVKIVKASNVKDAEGKAKKKTQPKKVAKAKPPVDAER